MYKNGRLVSSALLAGATLCLALFSTVSCEDETLFFIRVPSMVHLIDCTPQNCMATLEQIREVATQAALAESPTVHSPWVEAFGVSKKTRPSAVLVAVYSETSDYLTYPTSSSLRIPLEPLSSTSLTTSVLTDESIRLWEVDADNDDVEAQLHQIEDHENVLVLGLQLTPEAHRVRRQANESDNSAAQGPPDNIYNFGKEGSAASFEFGIWFAILFAISVFFICIVLMQIDEGDDSIIYKTTSAKMGKRD
ncbi:uncharacterized protein LOC142348798 [Convolutriloba macropyga]|uniref:uncharacterized protein LOC142348798 n=1 Tax=Convolutriloba macropyga TaxID=536237 RepID=UPI003F522F31